MDSIYVRYLMQRLEGLRRAVERVDAVEAPTVQVEAEMQEALEAGLHVD